MSDVATPCFSLAYTSARPACIAGVLECWFGRAHRQERVEAVVCVDAVDAGAGSAAVESSVWREQTRLVVNRGPRTCVAGWNEAARHTTGEVIVAVADDFDPPEGWDEGLAATGPAGWWAEDRVVAVRDKNVDDIFTLAILTRRRWERFGYVFHPAYASLFCDTEFTAVACGEGAVIDGRALVFEHRHHDIGKRAKDAVDRVHSGRTRWDQGKVLFLARQRVGFPREPEDGMPVPATGDARGALRFAVMVQATKDDFCLQETLCALLAQQRPGHELIAAVFFFCPDEYWSGRPTPPAERAEVQGVAGALRDQWPGVEFIFSSQHIAPFRVAANSRIEVETRARNAALRIIRAAGHEHIIVVDGDELWRPGLLAATGNLVRARQPAAIVSRMVPVVGLPGYPIDRATDRATIYVGPGASFVLCRSVCGPTLRLEGRGIFHFTATRRTMEEIVQKHRESGHYDDPDYDFEGWIKNVLPKIRPGWRGAHMYTPNQIWPRVRAWEPAEWAEVPASLHPFLGPELEGRWRRWLRRLGLGR